MRIYDTRIGKFLSVDPLCSSFPFWSPYHFAGNTPIQAIDLDGSEIEFRQLAAFFANGGTRQKVVDATTNLNDLQKIKGNVMGQASVGVLRFSASLVDGVGTLLFMGSLDKHDLPSSSYGSPCGMPGNENYDGTRGVQFYDTDPINADVNKIVEGNIATKNRRNFRIGFLAYTFGRR